MSATVMHNAPNSLTTEHTEPTSLPPPPSDFAKATSDERLRGTGKLRSPRGTEKKCRYGPGMGQRARGRAAVGQSPRRCCDLVADDANTSSFGFMGITFRQPSREPWASCVPRRLCFHAGPAFRLSHNPRWRVGQERLLHNSLCGFMALSDSSFRVGAPICDAADPRLRSGGHRRTRGAPELRCLAPQPSAEREAWNLGRAEAPALRPQRIVQQPQEADPYGRERGS